VRQTSKPHKTRLTRLLTPYTKEFLFSQSTNDRQILTLIDEALERIEDGDTASASSAVKRFRSNGSKLCPWAKYTIEIQEQLEKGLINEEE
jgi:DnaK suppressor protein